MTEIVVLVVDDSRAMRKVVSQTVTSVVGKNLLFLEAANGKQAIEDLQQNKIDLLFLDINMPIMDGYDVLKWLSFKRTSPYTVVVTSNGTPDFVKKASDLGADSYLVKPFNMEVFATVMERYFIARNINQGNEDILSIGIEAEKEDDVWLI